MRRTARGPARLVLAVAAAIALAVTLTATPATAAPSGGPSDVAAPGSSRPVKALLNGRTIDLSRGWAGAQVCSVFSRAVVVCYDTAAQANTALGERSAATTSCTSGWFCLYADPNFLGRKLQFRDEYWNYLSDYAFDRTTSSWRNAQSGGDSAHLSLYNRSTVYTCAAGSSAATMGSYDNQAYAAWG